MRQNKNNLLNGSDFLGFREAGTFGLLLALFWTSTTLPFYVRGFIVRVMGESVQDYVLPFFYILASLLCLPTIIKATKIWDYLFVFVLVSYFFGCYSWFPANAPYLKVYEDQFLFWSLPFFIVGVSTNFQKCQRLLYVFSALAILLQLFSLFVGGVSVNKYGELEDMGRAYGILPPVLYMIWRAFEEKTLQTVIIAIIGGLIVLFMGTRGPVMVVGEFVVLYLLLFSHFKNPVRAKTIIVLFSLLVFFILENSIELLMSISGSFGFSTRALESINLSGNTAQIMLESTGRDIIYGNLIDEIKVAPFWGYGPAADHIFTGYYEVYAHNIVLEMLIEYGKIPGSIIILLIVALILLAFKNCRDHDSKVFLMICVTYGFLGLMTSGVYWTNRGFFFMLGVCVAILRNSNKKIRLTK